MGYITISGITLDTVYKCSSDNNYFRVVNIANHLVQDDSSKSFVVCELLNFSPKMYVCELDLFKSKIASKEYCLLGD